MKFAVVVALATAVTALPVEDCGRRNNPKYNNYIIGGTETLPNEFPWQISFQVFMNRGGKSKQWIHTCGGSVLNDQWVITAAHCHTLTNFSDYRIIAGAHNLSKAEPTAQTFNVEKIILHPEFDFVTFDHDRSLTDVALVKIAGRFNLDGRTVAPVCLPTSSADVVNEESAPVLTVSGWGATLDNSIDPSDVLMHAELPIVPLEECRLSYRLVDKLSSIKESNICVGNRDLTRDDIGVCRGDSGGPLVYLDDGRYKLAGTCSFNVKCGSPVYPAVFVRVSDLIDWVNNTIAEN